MNIEFNCRHCNRLLAIDEKWERTEVECPSCGNSLVPVEIIAKKEEIQRVKKDTMKRKKILFSTLLLFSFCLVFWGTVLESGFPATLNDVLYKIGESMGSIIFGGLISLVILCINKIRGKQSALFRNMTIVAVILSIVIFRYGYWVKWKERQIFNQELSMMIKSAKENIPIQKKVYPSENIENQALQLFNDWAIKMQCRVNEIADKSGQVQPAMLLSPSALTNDDKAAKIREQLELELVILQEIQTLIAEGLIEIKNQVMFLPLDDSEKETFLAGRDNGLQIWNRVKELYKLKRQLIVQAIKLSEYLHKNKDLYAFQSGNILFYSETGVEFYNSQLEKLQKIETEYLKVESQCKSLLK